MAKSSKVIPKKAPASKTPLKKSAVKKASAAKSAPKKNFTKKPAAKKVAPKNAVAKKDTVVSSKKIVSAKKGTVRKVEPKNNTIGKNKVPKKTQAIAGKTPKATLPEKSNKDLIAKKQQVKKPVTKPAGKQTKQSRQQDAKTARANDFATMMSDTVVEKSESENSKAADPVPVLNTPIPAPVEKYAKPADPFHGKKAPVKGKSNITPAGKKPLWN